MCLIRASEVWTVWAGNVTASFWPLAASLLGKFAVLV